MIEHSLDYIVRCEATHWLIASYSGCAACFLTWIICSRVWPGQTTYRSPFWAGVFCALLSHWTVDGFTGLA
jgi:hypothetical protein